MTENETERLYRVETAVQVLKAEVRGWFEGADSKLKVLLEGTGGNCREHKAAVETLKAKVEALEEGKRWLERLIIGALISAFCSTVVTVVVGLMVKAWLSKVLEVVVK